MEQALLSPERDGWPRDLLSSTEDWELLGGLAARSFHGHHHDHCEDDCLLRSRARDPLASAAGTHSGAEEQLHAAGDGRAASGYYSSAGVVSTGPPGPAGRRHQR
eukprot:7746727-Pyramimonas_sp.AAC.1